MLILTRGVEPRAFLTPAAMDAAAPTCSHSSALAHRRENNLASCPVDRQAPSARETVRRLRSDGVGRPRRKRRHRAWGDAVAGEARSRHPPSAKMATGGGHSRHRAE